MALTSRARLTFQTEYIEWNITDEYPDHIKGAAVYRSFDEQEGYYVFDKEQKGYIPIHFLEDKGLWALIDYDDKKGSWFTTQPAPLKYGLGPYRSKPIHRIVVNTSEGELADEETVDTTDKGKQPTSKLFTPTIQPPPMSTTQAQTATASSSGLTIQAIPIGGGGGGEGGGGSEVVEAVEVVEVVEAVEAVAGEPL